MDHLFSSVQDLFFHSKRFWEISYGLNYDTLPSLPNSCVVYPPLPQNVAAFGEGVK